jgi:hypothetical protein
LPQSFPSVNRAGAAAKLLGEFFAAQVALKHGGLGTIL